MREKEFMEKLEDKIQEYEVLVFQKEKEGLLKPSTSKTYRNHSNNFVRWCKGEFIPGAKNKGV